MPHSGGLKNLSGTVGSTPLTVEQLASHRHDIKTFSGRIGAATPQQVWEATGNTIRITENTGGSQPHTHTLDGASGEANNLPPYYALSYIMRIA